MYTFPSDLAIIEFSAKSGGAKLSAIETAESLIRAHWCKRPSRNKSAKILPEAKQP